MDTKYTSDRREGCGQAVFRVLAAFIGIGALASVVLGTSNIEPAWLFVLGKVVLLIVGLFFLDVAITGGLGLFALTVFMLNRSAVARYVGYALSIGALITLVVINDKTDALRFGNPDYRLTDSFFYIGACIVTSALFYFLFWRKK